jgi:hypothetical protein
VLAKAGATGSKQPCCPPGPFALQHPTGMLRFVCLPIHPSLSCTRIPWGITQHTFLFFPSTAKLDEHDHSPAQGTSPGWCHTWGPTHHTILKRENRMPQVQPPTSFSPQPPVSLPV